MIEYGDRSSEADALMRLGEIHSAKGDHRAAGEAWQQAQAVLSELNSPGRRRAVQQALRRPRSQR